MAIEIFEIKWSKLYPFESAMNSPESKEGGVYAVYKTSNKIHYIGQTKDFAKRFMTHRQNATRLLTEAEFKKCRFSFGLVSSYEKSRMSNDISSEQLRTIESFLINEIKPVGNDTSTKKGYKGKPAIIINSGKTTQSLKSVMSHNNDLIQLLKKNLKTKPSYSYY